MTSGPCVFGCPWQADLDGHYRSFHHLTMSAVAPPKVSEPQASAIPTPQSTPPHIEPTKEVKYCYTCGHKLGAQTWREVAIAFVRYQMMVFWIGSFFGSLSGFEIAAKIFGH